MARYSVRSRVYVAGPLSIGDVRGNIERGIRMGETLSRLGYAPFVPHYDMLWDKEAVAGTPNYEVYLERDFSFITVCQALLRLSGESKGADREIAWAYQVDVPVFHTLDSLLESISPIQFVEVRLT